MRRRLARCTKNVKYWELNGFPKKLELNKTNLAALECNQTFQSYRMSGKVHCQLSLNGMAGFVAPFDGYAFQVSSNKDLVSKFLLWAEENPKDWDKNLYAVCGNLPNRLNAVIEITWPNCDYLMLVLLA